MMKRSKIAVFDLDGTILKKSFSISAYLYLYKVGLLPKHKFLLLVVIVFFCRMFRITLQSKYNFYVMKGMHVGKTMDALKDMLESDSWQKNLYDTVLEELIQLKKDHYIILLTGSPVPLIEELKQYIPYDYVIGSALEICDDHFTGHINGKIVVGKNKNIALNELVANTPELDSVKYEVCYANEWLDLFILNLFDRKVVVAPDKKLLDHATRNDWRVIDM